MKITEACRDISELEISAQTACTMFMQECEMQGLKVLITETYRPQERQDYLYEQGRTRPGSIVTWTRSSRHTGRRAWDICKNVKGEEYSDTGFFRKCGDIAKRLNITWGGTWSTPDMPHFEVDKNWQMPKTEEVDMEELNKIREQLESLEKFMTDYISHANEIINTMGGEIQGHTDIINIMGKEIDDLKKRS